MFAWGGSGADGSDAALLNAVLTTPLKHFDKSFQDMLIERGYDSGFVEVGGRLSEHRGLSSMRRPP